MFGKLCDVIISKSDGTSLVLCNHNDQPNTYYCEGHFERYEGTQTDTLTISIYNLPSTVRGQIALEQYSLLTVLWGYKDSGEDTLSELFMGNIQRLIFQRVDATTTITKMWVYDTGQFGTLGFFTGSYANGVNYYQIAQDILTQGNYSPESIQLSEKLKDYATQGCEAYYGSSNEIMGQIAQQTGMVYKSSYQQSLLLLPSEIVAQDTAVQFSYYDQTTRRVESKSGLVNIPSLTDDGMYFECLINPRLTVNKLIQIDNSVITIDQEGAVSSAQYGASLDPDGIYVVVNISGDFNNGPNNNTMRCKAYSRSIYVDSYKTDGEEE